MANDRRYLEFHGAQWRVQVKVPKALRGVLGKAKLVEPLHTSSLALANKRRWPVVFKFRKMLEAAEQGIGTGLAPTTDPLVREALEHAKELRNGRLEPDYDLHGELIADAETVFSSYVSARAEEISRNEDPGRASMFFGIASGTATPILLLVDQWLAERSMKPRQKIDYKRAVTKFAEFASLRRERAVIQRVSRRSAGEYVSEMVAARGHWKTINKDISALSTYWRWLQNKGHASENVWSRQSLPKQKPKPDQAKRPFTDHELTILINAEAPSFLRDAFFISTLSGMRVEEVARLRVKHCVSGIFDIREAKTDAGIRRVPIHSALGEVIARRAAGKTADEFLFDELPTPPPESAMERSQKISKAFTALRRHLKIDDRVEGARQSRIDFHSCRRWFAHKAKDALTKGATGFTPWTLAQVVGHEGVPLSLTMFRYAGDDGVDAMRACVEAVKLPGPFRNDAEERPTPQDAVGT